MSRSLRVMAFGASAAMALSAATFANAQGASEAAPEARLAWAKRHVELVCRPLEARQMFDRATRCYNDVARLVGDGSKALPTTAASKPTPATAATAPAPAATATRPAAPAVNRPAATRPAVKTAAARPAPARPAPARTRIVARQVAPASDAGPLLGPAPAASRRCSGIGCLQYTLLGVGF